MSSAPSCHKGARNNQLVDVRNVLSAFLEATVSTLCAANFVKWSESCFAVVRLEINRVHYGHSQSNGVCVVIDTLHSLDHLC
jgi:hypothetical protein